MTENQRVVREWFTRVWEEEDALAIKDLFEGSAGGVGLDHSVDSESFSKIHEAFLRYLSNIRVSIDKQVEQGEWIATYWTFDALHRQTGNPIVFTGSSMVRIKHGKFIEVYNQVDFLALLSQVGAVSPNLLAEVFYSPTQR